MSDRSVTRCIGISNRTVRASASVLRVLVYAIALSACAHSPERLPELDRRFYYNLPTPEDQDAFLRLEESERQAFLERKNLWSKWTALSSVERKAVATGDVKVGYKEFVAFMAWGPPADTKLTRADTREVNFHTFIRCTSGPKIGKYVHSNLTCDGTSSEVQIAVENGIITEIRHPD